MLESFSTREKIKILHENNFPMWGSRREYIKTRYNNLDKPLSYNDIEKVTEIFKSNAYTYKQLGPIEFKLEFPGVPTERTTECIKNWIFYQDYQVLMEEIEWMLKDSHAIFKKHRDDDTIWLVNTKHVPAAYKTIQALTENRTFFRDCLIDRKYGTHFIFKTDEERWDLPGSVKRRRMGRKYSGFDKFKEILDIDILIERSWKDF